MAGNSARSGSDAGPSESKFESEAAAPTTRSMTSTFDPAQTTVIFVLGGPGAGKGTQCALLVRDYGFVHLSAGDLLRAEQARAGSQLGELIAQHIRDGIIVPMEVTVALLENAMLEAIMRRDGATFLIDGFPRKMDQALRFERDVCPSAFTLFFDCPEPVLRERLLRRGQTSGRADDNPESIAKRFQTYLHTTMPVVEHYERQAKLVRVDASPGPDRVYADVRRCLEARGIKAVKGEGGEEGEGEVVEKKEEKEEKEGKQKVGTGAD
ncbi:MAG: bifunctional uridylate/adenylate kinase [Phylliscum demangeonii]|nr:MAG: bifunctional uridylate/adenylate kinase [Phylliscum demangeonii]